MKNRRFLVRIVTLSLCVVFGLNSGASAQGSFAGIQYFNPGYAYRHNLNPAFVPQNGYVGFPALGNFQFNMGSNLGLGNFFFPVESVLPDGTKQTKLGTFLHPRVKADDFLNTLHEKNYMDLNLQENILSAGWFWGRSFWNVSVGVRMDMEMNLPREFFAFLKQGVNQNPSHYKIENLGMEARAYVEAAVGYAREITPEWTVGGKFKFLIGLAQARMAIDKMELNLSEDAWIINSDANLHIFGRFLNLDFSEGGFMPEMGLGSFSPAGYGAAFDLGGEYRPNFAPGLRFSVSVTDLGFLRYNASNTRRYTASGEVRYEGFHDIGMDFQFGDELDRILDDATKMVSFTEQNINEGKTCRLNANLNFAVEYAIWNNRFSVGLINSTAFYGGHIESDLTLVANLRPCRWFSTSIAYSFIYGNRGLGWALNFTPKWGLNLFIASNYTPLNGNNYFIPVINTRMNVQLGITVPIGSNRRYTYEAEEFDVNAYPYTFPGGQKNPDGKQRGGGKLKDPVRADEEEYDYWGEIEREKQQYDAIMNGSAEADSTEKLKPVLEYEFDKAEQPAQEEQPVQEEDTSVEPTVVVQPEDESVIILDADESEGEQ